MLPGGEHIQACPKFKINVVYKSHPVIAPRGLSPLSCIQKVPLHPNATSLIGLHPHRNPHGQQHSQAHPCMLPGTPSANSLQASPSGISFELPTRVPGTVNTQHCLCCPWSSRPHLSTHHSPKATRGVWSSLHTGLIMSIPFFMPLDVAQVANFKEPVHRCIPRNLGRTAQLFAGICSGS